MSLSPEQTWIACTTELNTAHGAIEGARGWALDQDAASWSEAKRRRLADRAHKLAEMLDEIADALKSP